MLVRKLFTFFNNKVEEVYENQFLSFNRSFKYGDAIFETIRIKNKEIIFFNDHISRLKKGIGLLKFDLNVSNLKVNIEKIISDIISEHHLYSDLKIRIQLFREGEGLYTPEGNRPFFLFEVYLIEHFKLFDFHKQIRVGVSKESFLSNTVYSGLKTSNAIPYVIAGIEKKNKNLDDLIILNEKGFISECISSNIFWIDQNEIFTPALSCGCLEGVMRKNIISLMDDENIEVNEVKQNFSLIKLNDAIFFTSNVFGIKIISTIDNFYTLNSKKIEAFKDTQFFKILSSIE